MAHPIRRGGGEGCLQSDWDLNEAQWPTKRKAKLENKRARERKRHNSFAFQLLMAEVTTNTSKNQDGGRQKNLCVLRGMKQLRRKVNTVITSRLSLSLSVRATLLLVTLSVSVST